MHRHARASRDEREDRKNGAALKNRGCVRFGRVYMYIYGGGTGWPARRSR